MTNIKKHKSSQPQTSLKDGLISYFKGVKIEWGRITWPERSQVVVETIIVIGVVFFFTALIFVIDKLYTLLLSGILNKL